MTPSILDTACGQSLALLQGGQGPTHSGRPCPPKFIRAQMRWRLAIDGWATYPG